MKNIYFYLHLLIPIMLYSMVLWPSRILRYTFFLPLLLGINWVVFDGCFFTKYHQSHGKDGDLTQELLESVGVNISNKTAHRLNYIGLIIVIVLCAFKVMLHYKVFKK